MAVAYGAGNSQTFTSGGTAPTRNVSVTNLPASLASGQGLYIAIMVDMNPPAIITTPTGFTAVSGQTAGQDGWPGVKVFRKTATGSETSIDFTITTDTSWDIFTVTWTVTGEDGSTPVGDIQTSQPTGTSDTAAAPTVTPPRDGCLVILLAAIEGGTSDTLTAPAGTTIASRNSAGPAAMVNYIARDTGAYSAGNWTVSRGNSDVQDWNMWSIAIQPPAAGGGPSGSPHYYNQLLRRAA